MKRIFNKSKKSIPPINEIADALYDKQLSFTDEKIVKVIYSSDKTKRFVVLKSINLLF